MDTICMADELTLSIEKLVYGGDGLAHADGNTVFVPYVMPGEEVRAEHQAETQQADLGSIVGGYLSRAAASEGSLPALSNVRRLPLSAHPSRRATAVEERDPAGNIVAAGSRHLGWTDY